MIPIRETKLIQIEVTNDCFLRCANCTRFIGHHRQPFYMTLDEIEQAFDSLEGYPGSIGMMGGEPTMHPDFAEICRIYERRIPDRRKRELWTAGYRWEEYKDIIHAVFDEDLIAFNDHTNEDVAHQPLLVAIDEVVEDKELMWKIIDNCWIQRRWSASINNKGAFFCEIAASMDAVFDGPGGWPVEKGWWDKDPKDFKDQMERYCVSCSAPLPMQTSNHKDKKDTMSPGNAVRLAVLKSPKMISDRYRIADIKAIRANLKTDGTPGEDRGSLLHHPEWHPWYYRPVKLHAPEGEQC